jgi:CHAT domain-containing protein
MLPGAAPEARQVTELYKSPTTLLGEFSPTDIIAGLQHAEVFHFAGHAVFDATRPERSYLALAAKDGRASRIQVREIEGLRLSNSRVVVLSACRTLGARPTHSGGSAGLSAAFLRAGSSGVVSTMWEIDDDAARDVVVEFHRALQTPGIAPPAALRRAQIAAIRRAESKHQVSSDWAAFAYAGPWTIQNRRQ